MSFLSSALDTYSGPAIITDPEREVRLHPDFVAHLFAYLDRKEEALRVFEGE